MQVWTGIVLPVMSVECTPWVSATVLDIDFESKPRIRLCAMPGDEAVHAHCCETAALYFAVSIPLSSLL